MNNNLKKYAELKDRVESKQRSVAQAEGALQQALKHMQDAIGCQTLEEAREARKKVQQQKEETTDLFNKALEQFEKDWPE